MRNMKIQNYENKYHYFSFIYFQLVQNIVRYVEVLQVAYQLQARQDWIEKGRKCVKERWQVFDNLDVIKYLSI